MARSKAKKNASKKSKTPSKAPKEDVVDDEPSSTNLGPLAGVAAVVIVILAILFRPHQQPNDAAASHETIVENLTSNKSEWVPVNTPAVAEEKVEPPAEPEPITTGFSIAAFHNVSQDPPNKEDLIHYLRYDDGYTVCLKKEDVEYDEYGVWELKQAKLKYLEYIANDKSHWIFESPLSRDATCRILSLTHEDFDGVQKLQNVLKQGDEDEIVKFKLDKQSNASEYRTIVCLSRLVDLTVDQQRSNEFYQLKSAQAAEGVQAKQDAEAEKVRFISYGWSNKKDKDSDFHYYENGPFSTWIRPTARPGEKATMPLGKLEKKASLIVRKNPCPVKDSAALI